MAFVLSQSASVRSQFRALLGRKELKKDSVWSCLESLGFLPALPES